MMSVNNKTSGDGDLLNSSYARTQSQQDSSSVARQTIDAGNDKTDAGSSVYEDVIDDL
jgi:hypothetical protein